MACSLVLRSYVEADRPAVLALFDANVSTHFTTDERGLARGQPRRPGRTRLPRNSVDGVAAAFGGYEICDYYDKALLFRGMAHPCHHGRGLGRWLLTERLARIAEDTPPIRWVTVDTSPKVVPFFLSQGFETAGVWPHGYRTGGEMHVLRFDLAATDVASLKRRSAANRHAAEVQCA